MPVYKDKERGTWYAAFYYKDWTGARKHTVKRGFRTKGEASKFEKDFLDTLQRSSDITFGALVANYLDHLEPRIKPTTMGTKCNIINTKIMPYFEKLRVCDIDTITVINWQNTILAYRDDKGEPYSQTYIKTIHSQLSAILNYAVKHYGLVQNPCYLVGAIGKNNADEMDFWTKAEFDKFIACVNKPAYKLFFNILFYTGMRSGEALALTPEDIYEDRRINICKNFAIVDGEQVFLTPKTDKSKRIITIPNFLYDDILEYLGSLYGLHYDDRIFYFTKSSAARVFHACAKKAGVKEIRMHDLRHSHASLLIDMKVDIKQISERLGHNSVKVTWDIYSHLYPEKDTELALRIDELVNSTDNQDAKNKDMPVISENNGEKI